MFSQELRQRRTKMKLTLRQVAKKTKISFAALSRYERGIGLMEMSAGRAKVLAEFFRWNVKQMIRAMETETAQRTAQKEGEQWAKVPGKT